ncbi:response regulator [Pseudomonas sp. SED1]|uniref:response regulator n=1 Tax=Pseudomonas sp. SED1 TaxID=3056845 RepID=UPI00296E5313|nr:response regulator [Pseudomonas sp. SED1]MDY0836534.1 response regulator [Pseudomonas sp. SED1]
MVTKSLRILVVDACPMQRKFIEKLFNRLGYFGIFTTDCVAEAWTLNQYNAQPFDLLIMNVKLLGHPRTFSLTNPGAASVKQMLVYGLHGGPRDTVIAQSESSAMEWVLGLPEFWRVAEFMQTFEQRQSLSMRYDEVG